MLAKRTVEPTRIGRTPAVSLERSSVSPVVLPHPMHKIDLVDLQVGESHAPSMVSEHCRDLVPGLNYASSQKEKKMLQERH